MRVVVWIAEDTWEGCVDRAGALLPSDAEVTLLHVAPSDVEALASHGGARLLGRHPPPPPGPPLRAIAEEEARALLEAARQRLGRPADLSARRGKIEREALEACVGADLLVLARDGERRLEPKSLGPRTRFVLDHAPCQVLLVWPESPPSLDTIKLPPHLR
ncbi:MAG TPA: universal stress protein [Solirubrobacteraceae bacterium]|nr:universal stress protein [Solirubrobacteraceae bacterium]